MRDFNNNELYCTTANKDGVPIGKIYKVAFGVARVLVRVTDDDVEDVGADLQEVLCMIGRILSRIGKNCTGENVDDDLDESGSRCEAACRTCVNILEFDDSEEAKLVEFPESVGVGIVGAHWGEG